uniref:Uncharacterized protein n=1 Tax=Candidatus Kentrum sp. LPFa TaxID=2126335 RepID=A0A450WLZ4_9GAMM|nr:MAG: hypothetical protein BECKLPF1236A_GA0070988_101874 [Candidatus Kentron sp. LPFa]VFK33284.1 MAG: hypothetical protein BECKLPF1236C_GA0070990_102004 [Candidatus Kentron sp. LPFa]
MLVCPDDPSVLENFVYGDIPDTSSIRALIERLFDQGESIEYHPHQFCPRAQATASLTSAPVTLRASMSARISSEASPQTNEA